MQGAQKRVEYIVRNNMTQRGLKRGLRITFSQKLNSCQHASFDDPCPTVPLQASSNGKYLKTTSKEYASPDILDVQTQIKMHSYSLYLLLQYASSTRHPWEMGNHWIIHPKHRQLGAGANYFPQPRDGPHLRENGVLITFSPCKIFCSLERKLLGFYLSPFCFLANEINNGS